MDKGFINVLRCLGRCLEEYKFVSLRKLKPLFVADFSLVLQVLLVANKDDGHARVGMLKHFFKPPNQVLESVLSCNVVD